MTTPRPHDHPTYIRNRARLKATARATHAPCARCGQPINYDAASHLDPRAFTAGHRIAVADGGTHDPVNLQAEHRACNLGAGGHLGNTRRWGTPAPPQATSAPLRTSRDWT